MQSSEIIHLEFEKPIVELEAQLERLRQMSDDSHVDVSSDITSIEAKIKQTRVQIYEHLSPWQRVQIARHTQRPYAIDYIEALFTGFEELHGDRRFRDDAAIVGGPAWFGDRAVMVIGQQKGRNTRENLKRNFGCANPEGYRKALRLMQMAEKFRMPLITLIDTPGAFPGIGAEERHVAEAIALNIREMSGLKVPVIAAVIGEGGSGGALGIGVADRVLVFEHAYYSVISPEGCAAILWKDRVHAPEAASRLRLNSNFLKDLGVIDAVLPEPLGGAHRDPAACFEALRKALPPLLEQLSKKPVDKLLEDRYQKFREMGPYEEEFPETVERAPVQELEPSEAEAEPVASGKNGSNGAVG